MSDLWKMAAHWKADPGEEELILVGYRREPVIKWRQWLGRWVDR